MGLLDAPGVAPKTFAGAVRALSRRPSIALPAVGPPTITTQTTTTSTITGNVYTPFVINPTLPEWSESPKFTFYGRPRMIRDPTSLGLLAPNTYYSASGSWTVEFYTDAPVFEIVIMGQSGAVFGFYVNGQSATGSAVTGPNAGGLVIVTFGSRAVRRIRLVFPLATPARAVVVGPTDSVWPAPAPSGDRLLMVGDSYLQGANGVSAPDTYGPQLAELLGIQDVIYDDIGGTGFAADGGGIGALKKATYFDRLAWIRDNLTVKPNIIFLSGSTNDHNLALNGVHPDLATMLTSTAALCRAAWPGAKLVASGVMRPNLQNYDNAINVVMQASASLFDQLIDPKQTNAVWFSGSGKVSAPTGVGNSDVYLSSDSVHPSPAGHTYIAQRIAAALKF